MRSGTPVDPADPLRTPLARGVWKSRYRWTGPGGAGERDIRATWRRVAGALAAVESRDRDAWTRRFTALLEDFRFLPGGRVLAGAGTTLPVTLFNCFVGARPDGSRVTLLHCMDEVARLTLAGGGVGTDFSDVPPAAAAVAAGCELRGGPLPLLALWNALCVALSAGRVRHGALMATLRCDHPDLEAFVAAKRHAGDLRSFTLSVLVGDAFLEALERGRDWPLVFPGASGGDGRAPDRSWPGFGAAPRPCRTWRMPPASALWQAILGCAIERSEPGLLFIDTIRRLNPLAYAEDITAVNPCGEVPLPVYGACDLGSFNLTRFVHRPFTPEAHFDLPALLGLVPDAVRLLDNVYDLSAFPTQRHAETARGSRRIGLGITGLADTLVLLGLRYDSVEARHFAGKVMRGMCVAAYRASVALAREKGAFPMFAGGEHLRGEFVARLPDDVRAGLARDGLRNSHLLAIAPTGSISLLANGVSSGLEPLPALHVQRSVRLVPHEVRAFSLESYALTLFRDLFGAQAPLPDGFVDAGRVSPGDQLRMQAELQRHVDNAIAKTVTVPPGYSVDELDGLFRHAHALGLKGCTIYRPGSAAGAVLAPVDPAPSAAG